MPLPVPTWGSFQSFSSLGQASATTPGAMKQQKLSTWPAAGSGRHIVDQEA